MSAQPQIKPNYLQPNCHSDLHRVAAVARLSQEVRQLESAGRATTQLNAISTGCQAMDACLPAGGYTPGSVIEYLRTTSGCGATYLALTAAASALQASDGKYLVIIDTHHQFYPPVLVNHRISLSQVVWVRPQNQADAIWAMDQALRTLAVAAVIADLPVLDERDARRLQLAAERGGGLGLLLRGLEARRMPSWAEVQWVVRSLLPTGKIASSISIQHNSATISNSASELAATELAQPTIEPLRRLEVGLARIRGGKAGAQLVLNIHATTGVLELAPRENSHHHERITTTSKRANRLQSAS